MYIQTRTAYFPRRVAAPKPTPPLPFVYDDAGRKAVLQHDKSYSDCVCRAITIASGEPYAKVYQDLLATRRKLMKRSKYAAKSHPRTGIYRIVFHRYLLENGWLWVPCMRIGSGCKVHLRQGELPNGRLIVSLSQHLTAVIDGVIHDVANPSRGGMRCVYGYYYKPDK